MFWWKVEETTEDMVYCLDGESPVRQAPGRRRKLAPRLEKGLVLMQEEVLERQRETELERSGASACFLLLPLKMS